jgi:aminoglycoside phosphotransferase (APT) family kinase protein
VAERADRNAGVVEPVAVTTEEDGGLAALEAWLQPRLPDASYLKVVHGGKPGSGFSAETTIIDATWVAGGDARNQRFVLRKETPDPPVYPTQVPGLTTEVDIQYRVMTAVAEHSDVPIAPLLGYEGDASILGAAFFVMGFVVGVVPIESPPYPQEGLFTALSPESRRTMLDNGLRALAEIHAIDWKAAGLGWLVPEGAEPTAKRQLDLWTEYAHRELAGREHPLLERALEWLHANVPPEAEPALCWGDPRPGNVIWRDDAPACVTDFEAASIAPPLVDLGWWLMFDRTMHESVGITERAPGDLSRDEQRALYEQHVGHPVGDTTWYEVFAAARYCAIVVRVMNRLVERGQMPADHRVWIENPVTPCLEALMAEAGI